MPTIVCLGEALIDFVADVAGVSIQDCPGFRKAAGGAPANVAAGAARLGGTSAFIGKVGEDPFGRYLEATLAGCGVDVRGMRFDSEARTGLAFVSLVEDGERDFVFYRHPSADMRLRAEEVDAGMLRNAAVFHFGSITLIGEPSRAATLRALEEARSLGALISFDPNLRFPLWNSPGQARAEILNLLPRAQLVKVSDEELEFLAGTPAPEGAVRMLEQGPLLLCVTEGPGGCSLFTREWTEHVAGYQVEAVDTTGAGDGFVAGLLTQLHQQGEEGPENDERGLGVRRPSQRLLLDREVVVEAARFANAVGALTCTRKGAIPALPDYATVRRFMEGAVH